MAYSQTEHKAQSFAVCQICEESPDLKWKCIECELLFCHNCSTKFHSKSKTLAEHHIYDIKDCGAESTIDTIRQTTLVNITCQLHTGKKCSVFCKDCSVTICTKCIKELHKDHDFCDISEVYEEKLLKMKSYKNKVESNIEFYSQEEERLQQKISTGQKHYNEIKENIFEQENQIINAVRNHSKKLLSEVDSNWKPTEEIWQQQLVTIMQTNEELELTKNEINKTLQSIDASKVLTENTQANEKLLKWVLITPTNLKNFEFVNKSFSDNLICRIFGHVYAAPKFELVKSYETSTISSASKMLVLENNSAIIASFWQDKLYKVTLSNDFISIDTETTQSVYDMAMMQNGNDIIFSEKASDLKILNLGSLSDINRIKICKVFHSCHPFITLGLHVSMDNHILVGIAESKSFPTSKADSVNRIIVLSSEGEVEKVHEFDADRERLFTRPIRIKTDFKNNIYVVDLVNKSFEQYEGRVVTIEWTGNLRWIYTGVQIFDKFFPRDVEVTSTGTVLVSDEKNHALHLLSQAGEILGCKTLGEIGIRLPHCLYMTESEELLVACRKDDKYSNAKLHLLKLNYFM